MHPSHARPERTGMSDMPAAQPVPRPKRFRRLRRAAIAVAIASVGGAVLFAVGCVHRSGGTWMVDSAPLPEGWPELTPVGEVEVRAYPVYRAASVEAAELERAGVGGMFGVLFGHISDNDIAMTAPVDMSYAPTGADDGELAMSRMAFLYRTTDLGPTGLDGAVVIADEPERLFASVGVRGSYSATNYTEGLALVEEWLGGQAEFVRTGPPRFLGYNGPFTPWFMRYGEVQVPVERVETR